MEEQTTRSRSGSRYESSPTKHKSSVTSMPKWLRQKGRQASRLAGFKEGGVFDKIRYWNYIEALGRQYYTAPSRIKELLPVRGRRFVAVICFNGEVVVLENNESRPRVEWSGRVVPPMPADEGSSTQVRHACYDSVHGAFFFTVSFTGVFYAKLADIEADSKANKVTRLSLFVQRSSLDPNQVYHGIAADQENGVLFVCNQNCVTAWSTGKLSEPKKLQEITFQTPVSSSISPYKIAIYLDIRGSTKTLLAVSDKENSTLTQLRAKYSRNFAIGNTNAIQCEVISTLSVKGSKLGSLSKPQGIHFDPAGNLLVADDKNQRIQVFPFAQDGSTALDQADDELAVINELFSTLKSVAVVTTANDRPMILAGLCGPFGNFGAKKIMCLTYSDEKN